MAHLEKYRDWRCQSRGIFYYRFCSLGEASSWRRFETVEYDIFLHLYSLSHKALYLYSIGPCHFVFYLIALSYFFYKTKVKLIFHSLKLKENTKWLKCALSLLCTFNKTIRYPNNSKKVQKQLQRDFCNAKDKQE